MPRRLAARRASNGQRARRGRRLRLRYARLWRTAHTASDKASAESEGIRAADAVSREALSPGVQRALATIFAPGDNATDGEQRPAEAAEVPLRRVAEEPAHYNTAWDGEITPDTSGDG